MAKRSIARAVVLSAVIAMLAACVDNRPRNGAGEPVDPHAGTSAPGASTTR